MRSHSFFKSLFYITLFLFSFSCHDLQHIEPPRNLQSLLDGELSEEEMLSKLKEVDISLKRRQYGFSLFSFQLGQLPSIDESSVRFLQEIREGIKKTIPIIDELLYKGRKFDREMVKKISSDISMWRWMEHYFAMIFPPNLISGEESQILPDEMKYFSFFNDNNIDILPQISVDYSKPTEKLSEVNAIFRSIQEGDIIRFDTNSLLRIDSSIEEKEARIKEELEEEWKDPLEDQENEGVEATGMESLFAILGREQRPKSWSNASLVGIIKDFNDKLYRLVREEPQFGTLTFSKRAIIWLISYIDKNMKKVISSVIKKVEKKEELQNKFLNGPLSSILEVRKKLEGMLKDDSFLPFDMFVSDFSDLNKWYNEINKLYLNRLYLKRSKSQLHLKEKEPIRPFSNRTNNSGNKNFKVESNGDLREEYSKGEYKRQRIEDVTNGYEMDQLDSNFPLPSLPQKAQLGRDRS